METQKKYLPKQGNASSHPLYLKEAGTIMERKQFKLFLAELSFCGALK